MTACIKAQYASSHQADTALQRIRARGERKESGKKPTRAYLCPRCKRWHLTSEPK